MGNEETPTDGWSGLRYLLHGAPSERAWRAVVDLLREWPHGDHQIAMDYARDHLDGWPSLLRRTLGLDPVALSLARHIDLHWEGMENAEGHSQLDVQRLLTSSPHIEALSLVGRGWLEQLTKLPPSERLTTLRVFDCHDGDWQTLSPCQSDIEGLKAVTPGLRTLSFINCLDLDGLDLRGFERLESFQAVGFGDGSGGAFHFPAGLKALEMSAWETSHQLLASLEALEELPALERMALCHNELWDSHLDCLDDFPKLRHLDLRASRLDEGVRASLAESLPGVEVVEYEPSVALAPHCGLYRHKSDGSGGGESGDFEVSLGEDGRARFEYDWGGYWVSGMDADGDRYELSGGLYPISERCFLLTVEGEGGHLELTDEFWPYVVFGQSGCDLLHPLDVAPNYFGPFNQWLDRV